MLRLNYKIAPSNLLDIYHLATPEEKKELKKKVKLNDKSNLDLLQNFSLQEEEVNKLPIVRKYLNYFEYEDTEASPPIKKKKNFEKSEGCIQCGKVLKSEEEFFRKTTLSVTGKSRKRKVKGKDYCLTCFKKEQIEIKKDEGMFKFFQSYSYSELAEFLGQSEKLTRDSEKRCEKKLQQLIQESDFGSLAPSEPNLTFSELKQWIELTPEIENFLTEINELALGEKLSTRQEISLPKAEIGVINYYNQEKAIWLSLKVEKDQITPYLNFPKLTSISENLANLLNQYQVKNIKKRHEGIGDWFFPPIQDKNSCQKLKSFIQEYSKIINILN